MPCWLDGRFRSPPASPVDDNSAPDPGLEHGRDPVPPVDTEPAATVSVAGELDTRVAAEQLPQHVLFRGRSGLRYQPGQRADR
jgi:hypothetical protein